MATFQEMKAKYETPANRGFVGNILSSLTQPFRRAYESAKYAASAPGGYKPMFDSSSIEDIDAAINEPTKQVLKSIATAGSFLVPAGAADGAVTTGSRIGTAALRGAGAGTLGGYGYSKEGEELKGALTGGLTGGLFAGALQGIGEGAKALTKTAGTGKVVNTLDVDEIAKLPSRTRSGLVKQAKSAGFWDGGLSESKNIQNYLTNRGLAGNTPAETLENLTQEFNRASKLKQEGLKEIGGLSKSYIDKIKGEIDDAVRYSGLGTDEAKVVKDMKAILDKAPRDAKTLDSIAQKWYDRGLTKAGDLKSSQAALYKYGAKTIRDNLKLANQGGSYSEGMRVLSQILGLQDEGLVAKTAARATDVGINVPLFSSAGFRGADIKLPFVSDIYSKTRAAIGRGQEMGGSGILGEGFSNILQNAAAVGQRAVPAVAGLRADTQEVGTQGVGTQPIYPTGTIPTTQGGQQGVGAQGISAINLMLAQGVLNGQISATEANAVLSLLGMDQGGATGKMTESQRDYQLAAEAMEQAYDVLEQAGGAGKLATLGGNIAGFFGSTSASSEYRAALDTATAFLRKALIGSGQSEAELKNLNLPKPTDEPEIAKQKIMTLIPLLRARAGLQQY